MSMIQHYKEKINDHLRGDIICLGGLDFTDPWLRLAPK